MSRSVVGAQLEGAPVLHLGFRPMPQFLLRICEQNVGLGKIRIEFQSFSGSADHFRARFCRGSADKNGTEVAIRVGQAHVGRGECGVYFQRVLEVTDAFLDVSSAVAFVESGATLEIALIDFGRDGMRGSKPFVLFSGDGYLDLFGNGLRQLALQSKSVAKFAIVGFRPEVLVGRSTNQLGSDTNPAAVSNYGAFDEGIDAERSGYVWRGELRISETHHGGVRNDAQIVDRGEPSDECFGHAVSEVFLCGIAGQVLQRQHRQRLDFGAGGIVCAISGGDVGDGEQTDYSRNDHCEPAARPWCRSVSVGGAYVDGYLRGGIRRR